MKRAETAPCLRNWSSSAEQNANQNIPYAGLSHHRPPSSTKPVLSLSAKPPLNVHRSSSRIKFKNVNCKKQLQTRSSQRQVNSAPPQSFEKYSRNILDLRGKCYDEKSKTLDIMSYLKERSIPRRIQRLINEPSNEFLSEAANKNGYSKYKGFSSEDVVSVLGVGLNNKQLSERRRGLHLRRSINKSEALSRIMKAFRQVLFVCRVKLIMAKHSIDLDPATNIQISWSEKRHTREAGEVLFSKYLYQRGPSIYTHVPKWAETILRKSPIERTDREVLQIHAMMQGLVAYDKFTRRVQIAMCHSMKFVRIEYPRVILRKGHIGLAFYFIFSGSVFINIKELCAETNEMSHKTVSTLNRGDAFGEVALLQNVCRTASVVVREDVELMAVDKYVFAQVCSEIYEKEMEEKIDFCRNLPLFTNWRDDAVKHICHDSQIHEYKPNKIIVRDTVDEEEWIYICMQGQCRVIKKLEFDQKPERSASFISRQVEEEGCSPVSSTSFNDGNDFDYPRNRTFSSDMEIMKELEISIKQTDLRKIAKNQILDNVNAIKSRSFQGKKTKIKKMGDAEEILNSFGKTYQYLCHTTGDTQYSMVKNEKKQSEFLKSKEDILKEHDIVKSTVNRRRSIDLTTMLNEEFLAGRLNKTIAYLNIATVKKGDVFNLREVLEPTGRQLILVSLTAKILQIKKQSFFLYATKNTLLNAKALALENNYPEDDALYYQYRKKCMWEVAKTIVLQQTMAKINITCVSRGEEPSKPEFTAKQRVKSARQVSRRLLTS